MLSTRKINGNVDLLAIHQSNPGRYPFLLESVASLSINSRFSILFAFPQDWLRLETYSQLNSTVNLTERDDFFSALDQWFQQLQIPNNEINPNLPFTGGWFLYLGYETAKVVEPVLELPDKKLAPLPDAFACRIPCAIIIDKAEGSGYLLAEAEYEENLEIMAADIADMHPLEQNLCLAADIKEEDPQRYLDAIKQTKQYIVDGDIFQANLSRAWQATLPEKCTSTDLYFQLRKTNPAPFAGMFSLDEVAVISSSPERLVSIKNNVVETRPIAGTRPRKRTTDGSIDEQADQALLDELISHPKERAEHVMLIDLERNDLGRIAKPGSVEVNELMVLETYEHVHHIVSNVKAIKRDEVSPGEVIKAVFPGGTITGCPKIRCMEIIAELEQTPRQAYTGSMGYLNRNGDMDLNILIRTMIKSGSQLHIRAGGGIVADSNPEKELAETRAKAKGMLNALNAYDSDKRRS